MTQTRILAAQFGAAVGIKGEVRVSCYLENPQTLLNTDIFDKLGQKYKFNALRPQGDKVIARIEGINDRTQAESLTRKDLFIDKSALPASAEGEYYHSDLIGLKAYSSEGLFLGEVKAVVNYGAGDLLEVGQELYPFTNAFVPNVDLAAKRVTINVAVSV